MKKVNHLGILPSNDATYMYVVMNDIDKQWIVMLYGSEYNLYINGVFFSKFSPDSKGVSTFNGYCVPDETDYLNSINRWIVNVSGYVIVLDQAGMNYLNLMGVKHIISSILLDKHKFDGMVYECDGALYVFMKQDALIYQNKTHIFIAQLVSPYNIHLIEFGSKVYGFYEDIERHRVFAITSRGDYMFSA